MHRAIRNFEVSVLGPSVFVRGLFEAEGDSSAGIAGVAYDKDRHISLLGLATPEEAKEIGGKLEALLGPLRERAERKARRDEVDRARRDLELAEERMREMDKPAG